ncbi:MAG: cupin domain-containing protein [Firmicutes bacterium HGW-Firmicutes-14]|nr:MAG: cupin domain-containing protein [Methanomicrobiales archaeon HGW-Methanomicrobiales-5]PKM80013.1 MAG: cupin domain-containing protein [Firmicutes bacterium HGW-Firmicutes-14]
MLSEGWKYPAVHIEPPNERYIKIIESPEITGYENATILFSHIPPGGTTGLHTHPDNDEIMYFVGRGEAILDGKRSALETDSVLVAQRGVEHQCINTSKTETLKLFCVFVPALKISGPLEKLAEETKKFLQEK